MPWALTEEADANLSFADDAGMGRKVWAGEGLAGSSGGAFMVDLGIDAIGWECRTSFLQ
jgi:hypothetical protein